MHGLCVWVAVHVWLPVMYLKGFPQLPGAFQSKYLRAGCLSFLLREIWNFAGALMPTLTVFSSMLSIAISMTSLSALMKID